MESDNIVKMDKISRNKIETFRIKHKRKMQPTFKEHFVDVQSSRYGKDDGAESRESSVDEDKRGRRHKCCYKSLDS